MLGGLADRREVTNNVGHQVSAHFNSGVKVILKQTSWQFNCFDLRDAGNAVVEMKKRKEMDRAVMKKYYLA